MNFRIKLSIPEMGHWDFDGGFNESADHFGDYYLCQQHEIF